CQRRCIAFTNSRTARKKIFLLITEFCCILSSGNMNSSSSSVQASSSIAKWHKSNRESGESESWEGTPSLLGPSSEFAAHQLEAGVLALARSPTGMESLRERSSFLVHEVRNLKLTASPECVRAILEEKDSTQASLQE